MNRVTDGTVCIDDREETIHERYQLASERAGEAVRLKEPLCPFFRLLRFHEDPCTACYTEAAAAETLSGAPLSPELKNLLLLWAKEYRAAPEFAATGRYREAVLLLETHIQILLAFENAGEEMTLPEPDMVREIIYFYLYDYADELCGRFLREPEEERERSLIGRFLWSCRTGDFSRSTEMALFWGRRLSAAMKQALKPGPISGPGQVPGTGQAPEPEAGRNVRNQEQQNPGRSPESELLFIPEGCYSAHQLNVLKEFMTWMAKDGKPDD